MDYGNIKITQHALRVSVFKVLKLDTKIMEEEEEVPSLINLMVSVDVKHHVYLLRRRRWELYTLHKTSLFSCKILHRTFPNNGQKKIS